MPRNMRAEAREALRDFEDDLAGAAALCRALVTILRSPRPLDGEDIEAALRIAELAESHASTARHDWQTLREKQPPASNRRRDR